MPVRKKFSPDPIITGEYAYEASRKKTNRDDRLHGDQLGLQYDELRQRGDLALLQMQQHGLDRASQDYNRALDRQYDANRYEAGLEAEAADRERSRKAAADQDQMRANLDLRNHYLKTMPPDFSAGPFQTHELAQLNNEVLSHPNQRFKNEVLNKASGGDQEAIRTALSRGWMAYSEEDQQVYNDLQAKLREVRTNKSLDDSDMVKGEVMILSQLNRIQPQIVPPDQQPKTVSEQMQETVGTWTDQTTGITYPAQIEVRNGQQFVSFVETPEYLGKVEAAKAKAKAQFESQKPAAPKSAKEKVEQDPAYRVMMWEKARSLVAERIKSEAMAKHEQDLEAWKQERDRLQATDQPPSRPQPVSPTIFRQPRPDEVSAMARVMIEGADSLGSASEPGGWMPETTKTLSEGAAKTGGIVKALFSGGLGQSQQQQPQPRQQPQQPTENPDDITTESLRSSLRQQAGMLSHPPQRRPTVVMPEPSNDDEAQIESQITPVLEGAAQLDESFPDLRLADHAKMIRDAVTSFGWDSRKWPRDVAAKVNESASITEGVVDYVSRQKQAEEAVAAGKEPEDVRGEPLPRGTANEREMASRLQVGTVYHVEGEGDSAGYDVIWDGKRLIKLATYTYKKQETQ